MCGLVGSFSNKEINIETIDRMIGSLKHRGPDNQAYHYERKFNLFFGHTRLSILDISDNANQPIFSSCGRYILIFNGEIYNYLQIKNNLNNSFHIKWSGNGDTEVIINSIEKIGFHKTLSKLKGMFALAVLDKKLNKIFFARDQFGEKPLYFGNNNSRFYFSSELKAITSDLNFNKQINPLSVKYLMSLNYIPSPLSIYKNIHKLKHGHYLEVILDNHNYDNHQFNQTKYVKDEKKYKENSYNFEDNKKKLKELFFNSVENKMVSDVEVGSFLSSGVDSSLVASAMTKISKKKIKTFSLGYDNKNYDESSEAFKIAEYLDTDHYNINFKYEDAAKIIFDLPNVYCEPFSDSSQIPTSYLTKFTSQYVKVCFSGDGGDELFGGYNRYINSNLVYDLFLNKNKFKKFVLNLIGSRKFDILFQLILKFDFLFPSHMKIHNLIQKSENIMQSLNSKNLFEMYFSSNSHWDFNDFVNHETDDNITKEYWNEDEEYLKRIMLFDCNTYLPDDLLVKIDRASMSNGLEVRSPFLDENIKDLAFSLPKKFKINNKQGKIILRSLLKDLIPDKLIMKQKKGFLFPLKSILKKDLREWADNYFKKDVIESTNLFNSKYLLNEWNLFKNDKVVNEYKIWDYLMFQDWYSNNF